MSYLPRHKRIIHFKSTSSILTNINEYPNCHDATHYFLNSNLGAGPAYSRKFCIVFAAESIYYCPDAVNYICRMFALGSFNVFLHSFGFQLYLLSERKMWLHVIAYLRWNPFRMPMVICWTMRTNVLTKQRRYIGE